MDFVRTKEDFLSKYLRHLGTSAIMDLLLKMVNSTPGSEARSGLSLVSLTLCSLIGFVIVGNYWRDYLLCETGAGAMASEINLVAWQPMQSEYKLLLPFGFVVMTNLMFMTYLGKQTGQ